MGGFHRRAPFSSMPTHHFFIRSGPPATRPLGLGRLGSLMLLCLGFALGGCQSSGGAAQGPADIKPGSVTYSNAARGNSLSLVSESMLIEMGIPGDTPAERTLAFNSTKRASASVKVCSDEILEGVVQLFDSEGFDQYATVGAADLEDRSSDGVLQVKFNGVERFLLNSDSAETDPNAKVAFANLLNMFAQIYGEVKQYQAVDGQVEFKKAEISPRLRGQATGSGLLPGSIR